MARIINWFLTVVACSAGAALVADGVHPGDLFNDDATILLCIATTVPAVVVAIRRNGERTRAALIDLFDRHAAQMEACVDRHAVRMETAADTHATRTGKHTVETAMGTLAHMVTEARMDRADRAADRWWADTGPFRAPHIPR